MLLAAINALTSAINPNIRVLHSRVNRPNLAQLFSLLTQLSPRIVVNSAGIARHLTQLFRFTTQPPNPVQNPAYPSSILELTRKEVDEPYPSSILEFTRNEVDEGRVPWLLSEFFHKP
jgi:hypothetical protein